MKYFVGLDVSLEQTSVCIVNDDGVIVREGKAGSEPAALAAWLAETSFEFQRLGLEAGPLSPWLYEAYEPPGSTPSASRPAG
jgi:transposase